MNTGELSLLDRFGSPAEAVHRSVCRVLLWGALALPCALHAVPQSHAAEGDGTWRLEIAGHQTFLFGEPTLGGGIRIPWGVVIDFDVSAGRFGVGSGTARWLDRVAAVSRPAGWFDCAQVQGSYLDSNLALHETPRVRFAAFPVAGGLRDGRIELRPGYQPPGNYLAVTYRCETQKPGADNWFALAERGKQVLGKRQDVETRRSGDTQTARVREVAALPPEGTLDLPLLDGWSFAQGDATSDRLVRYSLRRLN